MAARPRITFDTTAINQLEDAGADSVPLMRALEVGYDVGLTAMNADEIISNARNPQRREALLRRFGWLLQNAWCTWPPNEVVKLHVFAYHRDPTHYHWNSVNVRAKEYENAIAKRAFPDDIYEEQRRVQFELEKQFEQTWKSLRPKLDEIIARDPSQRLSSFSEAAEACVKPGGVLWGFGKGLYEHAVGVKSLNLADDDVRAFIEVCPPFRSACYALVMSWYNFSLSPTHTRVPRSGRNDLMMAAYSPY
jgi:hypothetical protein